MPQNGNGPIKEKKKLKGWRLMANGGYDHQFLNVEKLDILDEKERKWKKYQEDASEFDSKPPSFTKKDIDLREKLLKQGYTNWSKKDFFHLIRMCEYYGRDNFEEIALQFKSKTIEEIETYCDYFFKNYEKLENGQKYIDRIEKGEAEIEK